MKRLSLIHSMLVAATFTTTLAFFPVSVVRTTASSLQYALWAILLLLLFLHNRKVWVNNRVIWMLLAYAGCVLATNIAVRIGDYASGSTVGMARFFLQCVFFYFVGYNFTVHTEDAIKGLFGAFCVGVFLVAAMALLQLGGNVGKNQLGQMFGIAAICGLFVFPRYAEGNRRLWFIFCGIVSVIALFAIRSRTPIVGIAIVFAMHLLSNDQKSRKAKGLQIVLVALGVIAVIFAVEFGMLDVIFNGYSPELGRDVTLSEAVGSSELMDVVLSGRLSGYSLAWNEFIHHPLFGIGPKYYIDNFVMHVLRAGGLWYAFCLLPIVYGTLFNIPTQFRKMILTPEAMQMTQSFAVALRDIALFYFVLSMGEGYPPIGPGSSAFFLWLLLGFGNQMIAAKKAENTPQGGKERF